MIFIGTILDLFTKCSTTIIILVEKNNYHTYFVTAGVILFKKLLPNSYWAIYVFTMIYISYISFR